MKSKIRKIIPILCILLMQSCRTETNSYYLLIVNKSDEDIVTVLTQSFEPDVTMYNYNCEDSYSLVKAKSGVEYGITHWDDDDDNSRYITLRIIKKSTADKYTKEEVMFENYIFDKKIVKSYRDLAEQNYVITYDGKD